MVRPLLFGIVGTVRGRVRGDEAAVRAVDWAEAFLTPEFFAPAPFKTISLILLYSSETNLDTDFQRRRKDELPIAIQVDLQKLRKMQAVDLENAFRYVILKALIDVATKYRLPVDPLQHELARLPAPAL